MAVNVLVLMYQQVFLKIEILLFCIYRFYFISMHLSYYAFFHS